MMEPKKSSKLDNYNVMQCIGQGAYGTVNLAVDKKSGNQVAIKAVSIEKIVAVNKDKAVLREKDLMGELSFKNAHVINLLSTFKVSN